MNKRDFKSLSIVVSGGTPPSEFKIFESGIVDTTKGRFVFDDKAARAVMADFQRNGVDLMIDYDHASLGAADAPDPAQAGKAAGWFNLEVRNGELWAKNVRWTQPAADALSRKEWRFMSPTFHVDGDRIVSLLNVAITNMPATRNLQPLMAAAKDTGQVSDSNSKPLTLDELVKVAKTLDMDPATTLVADIMAKLRGQAPASDTPPARGATMKAAANIFNTSLGPVTLSASELAACADAGTDPQVYAQNRAVRDAARKGRR